PPTLSAFSTALRDALEFFLQACELFIREPLQIDEARPRALSRAKELVEFELQRARVAVLRVLQQKRDQKRHLRRKGVHRELPRVGKMKARTGSQPHCGDHNH